MTVIGVMEDLAGLLGPNYKIERYSPRGSGCDLRKVCHKESGKILARTVIRKYGEENLNRLVIHHQEDWRPSLVVEMIRGLCTSHRISYVMNFDQ